MCCINKLNKAAKYEIWHQRLLHPGGKYMCTIYKYVDGIDGPLIGNWVYHCVACMHGKPRKSGRAPPHVTINISANNKELPNIRHLPKAY